MVYKYWEKRIWGKVLVPTRRTARPYKKDILDAFVKDTDTITRDDLNAMGFHGGLNRTLQICAKRTNTVITQYDNYTWDIQPIKTDK